MQWMVIMLLWMSALRVGARVPDMVAMDTDVPDVSLDHTIFTAESLPDNMRYMPSVSNGHLAYNIYSNTTFMNGFYNGPTGWSHRCRIQAKHASNLSAPGTPVSRTHSLNTTTAVFTERIETSQVVVKHRVLAHHYYTRLLVTEVQVDRVSGATGDIIVTRTSLAGGDSDEITFETAQAYTSTTACTGAYTCSQQRGVIKVPETPTSGNTSLTLLWTVMPNSWTLPAANTTAVWTYLLAADFDDGVSADFDVAQTLISDGNASRLAELHIEGWADVWAQGNIEMQTTDLHLAKVVRGCLYYLYSNLPSQNTNTPNNQFYSLSPGGLANGRNWTDYQGHVFWDTETWMYPGILMLRPDLAKDILSYRIHGLTPARARAASGGYTGARFPWESAYTGDEMTPDICPACRDNQQHITGDIGFAARQYVSATRDLSWLNSTQSGGHTGYQLLHDMADFWQSRPQLNASTERWDINGVMPPDEHQVSINNSIYTNTGASLAIHFARYAACLAGLVPATEVPDAWVTKAYNLAFPYNREHRYHEEYDTYQADKDAGLVDADWVKQADVVLLGFPNMLDMPDDVRVNDLEEYELVTDPGGPAMTWGMFNIGWLQQGDLNRAAGFFNRSYQSYVRQPYKIWTESQSGLGAINFVTGMGGFLQTLVFGYAGLKLQVERLEFGPAHLPPATTSLTLRHVDYLGAVLDYTVSVDDVELSVVSVGSTGLVLKAEGGSEEALGAGLMWTFPSTQTFYIYSASSTGCELPPTSPINVDYTAVPSSPTQTASDLPPTQTASDRPPVQTASDRPPVQTASRLACSGTLAWLLAATLILIV